MRKQNLIVKTFQVPIERKEDGTVVEKQVEITEDMLLKSEPHELKSPVLELPTLSKKVAQFNERQIKFAEEDANIDYIRKKIITK